MDIFNRKRVEELEKELEYTQKELDKYKDKLIYIKKQFEEVTELQETIPEGCTKGPWCKACEFAKEITYVEHYHGIGFCSSITAYVCSKGKSCENFVQKEIS